MAIENEELDLNLEELDRIESGADNKLQVRNRFQQLANDKRTLAQEKEQAEAKLKEEAEARLQAEKSLEFYKTFSTISSKHPEATQYQEQILERVNRGMDPEEATVAVLYKEGKLGPQAESQPNVGGYEGGSAVTNVNIGDKPIHELPPNEKLLALQEMEKSGELIQALKAGINRS